MCPSPTIQLLSVFWSQAKRQVTFLFFCLGKIIWWTNKMADQTCTKSSKGHPPKNGTSYKSSIPERSRSKPAPQWKREDCSLLSILCITDVTFTSGSRGSRDFTNTNQLQPAFQPRWAFENPTSWDRDGEQSVPFLSHSPISSDPRVRTNLVWSLLDQVWTIPKVTSFYRTNPQERGREFSIWNSHDITNPNTLPSGAIPKFTPIGSDWKKFDPDLMWAILISNGESIAGFSCNAFWCLQNCRRW